MNHARLLAVLALAGTLTACSGGSGPPVTTTNPGRDDPGNGRDNPGNGRDSPASSSGGSGTNTDCVQCDVEYECSGNASFELSSAQGNCNTLTMSAICSGAAFGTSACTATPGGGFTCGSVSCSPVYQGGTSSGGAVPVGTGGGATSSSSGG